MRPRLAALVALLLCLTGLGVLTAAPSYAAAPANDDLAGATSIGSGYGKVIDVAEAGVAEGESEIPRCLEEEGQHSVWYSFTAPADETAWFTTSGDPDATYSLVVEIYTTPTGATPTFDSLSPVACNATQPFVPSVDAWTPVTAGTT